MNIEASFDSQPAFGRVDQFDEGARLAEICDQYTPARIAELRDSVTAGPGDLQDQQIAAVFDEVAPVLSEVQSYLDAGHLDREMLARVTETAGALDALVEEVMSFRQQAWH